MRFVESGSRIARSLPIACLIGGLGCGGAEPEPTAAPEGCTTGAECGDRQLCQAGACVDRPPLAGMPAGAEACAVLNCPESEPDCCMGAAATALGNERQSFSSQLHMVQRIDSDGGFVRADFRFDYPNQQGWVTFDLGTELELEKITVTGRRWGQADRFLSLNANQSDRGGCAFAFQLEPQNPSEGAFLPTEVMLDDARFCYGTGHPGRADQLAFAIFSSAPGDASLVISNIALTAR